MLFKIKPNLVDCYKFPTFAAKIVIYRRQTNRPGQNMETNKLIRYTFALTAILLMVGIAEWAGEKEIIFPEMVALSIGAWIIDKRVWKVKRWQMVKFMTLGAIAGLCIVRYSPFPSPVNLSLAFAFAGLCLLCSRTTLIPLISACMLPVLLQTHSWIYPLSVCLLSLILALGQKGMETCRVRKKTAHLPAERDWKKDSLRWLSLLAIVFLIALLASLAGCRYLVIPPLVVTFAEIVHSKAGFRSRPVQLFLYMTVAALLGTGFQLFGYYYLHLPETVVAFCIVVCLFALFEWTGKYFAPAGALAFIPLIVPRESLTWLPMQASLGAALFITIAMLVFLRCYTWSRAQLFYCLTPSLLRRYREKRRKEYLKIAGDEKAPRKHFD